LSVAHILFFLVVSVVTVMRRLAKLRGVYVALFRNKQLPP
jgi:hypothetical protein